MRSYQSIISLALGLFAMLSGFQASAHEEAEIIVGRNSAGQIKVHLHFSQPVELEPSTFPGMSGYISFDLAFHSTILDEPDEDFFQLSPTANLQLVMLAKDPGMELWTGLGFMAVNDSFQIGIAPFDSHPIWNLVSGTPGNSYSLTFKLVDTNGVYTESAPFTLSFTPPHPPDINIALASPQQLLLSWPTNAVDWELQSAASLTATNWDPVTNAPSIVGGNFSLSLPTGEAQQFFRLHQH